MVKETYGKCGKKEEYKKNRYKRIVALSDIDRIKKANKFALFLQEQKKIKNYLRNCVKYQLIINEIYNIQK